MLDQWGKEVGGPSLEQRVKDLEQGFGEIVTAVVRLQQTVGALLNRASIQDARNLDKGEMTNGVFKQPSEQQQGTDEVNTDCGSSAEAGDEADD